MYKVRIERKAIKKLAKIPEPYYSKIKSSIISLAKEPKPKSCKKLKDREAFRIRVANYRIIYEVHDKILLIDVIEIGHRKEIYK